MNDFIRTACRYRTDVGVAIRFFTRLPWLSSREDSSKYDDQPGALTRALGLAPLIGLGLGILGGAVLELASSYGLIGFPAAFLAILTLVLLTGGLHEDGLADTADALGAGNDRTRALSIMRDSHIGSFGVLALMFSLGLRVSALAVMPTHEAAMSLIAAAAFSRVIPAILVAVLSSLRDEGLGALAGAMPEIAGSRAVLALVIAGFSSIFAIGATITVWCIGLIFIIAVAMSIFFNRRFGGYTGDVLGASQQVAEVALLLLCVAAYKG